jgi:hypothetical protein
MPNTCFIHFILHDLTTLILLSEEHKLSSSLLCNFLQPPANSSLFGQNMFLRILF